MTNVFMNLKRALLDWIQIQSRSTAWGLNLPSFPHAFEIWSDVFWVTASMKFLHSSSSFLSTPTTPELRYVWVWTTAFGQRGLRYTKSNRAVSWTAESSGASLCHMGLNYPGPLASQWHKGTMACQWNLTHTHTLCQSFVSHIFCEKCINA